MKQDIENIIKKNLPMKYELSDENYDLKQIHISYNEAIDDIDTSLIADEVLKVVEKNKGLFNTEELDKDWINNFYESAWGVDTLNMTQFEKDIIEELSWFLPRHMDVYDWNLPYAEAIILIIRNLLKGQKLITGEHLSPNKENKNNE